MKKHLLPMLCLVMCLSLVGCGKDKTDEDVAGADWRTTGVVISSGTVTRDRNDTAVLVCLDKDGVKLYCDKPVKELFASADFHIPFKADPRDSFESIDFSDIDGDFNSDITLTLGGEQFQWTWNNELGKFECWEATTEQVESTPKPVDYVGYWYCADGGYWLRVYGDDTWDSVESGGEAVNSGYLTATTSTVKLYMSDEGLVSELDLKKDGTLYDTASSLKHVYKSENEVPQAVRTNLEKGGYNG